MPLKSPLHLSPEEVPIALANSKSGRDFPTCFVAKMPINKPVLFVLLTNRKFY